MTSIAFTANTPSAHIELLLISAVLKTGDFTGATESGVDAEKFVAYRQEWEWIEDSYARRKTVPLTADFLRHWSSVQLQEADDVVLYADQLVRSWAADTLRSNMVDAADALASGGPGGLTRAVEGLSSVVRTINKSIEPANSYSLTGNGKEITREIQRRFHAAQTNGGMAGTSFGRNTLDYYTGGKLGQLYAVIAARTNVGKSWELLAWLLHAAAAGKKCLLFSLEMDRIAVSLRLLAMESYLNGSPNPFDPGALAQGRISKDVGKQFGTWVDQLASRIPGSIEIIDKRRSNVSTASVVAACDRFQPDEVYVDGIQILKPGRRLGNQTADWQAVAEVSADLFDLSAEGGIPVIATSQINRTQVSNHTPPDVDGLARSDAIGQDADLVITMTDYAPNVLRAKIAKNRLGGGKGTIYPLAFEPNRGRVEEISATEAEQLRVLAAQAAALQGLQP